MILSYILYVIILFQKKGFFYVKFRSYIYNYFLLISCPLLTYIKIIEINEVYPFLFIYLFLFRKIYRVQFI